MQTGAILLVEDEPDLLSVWADILENKGYTVATAADGREALDYLERQPRPALIFLDLSMPVINGVRFLQSMHSGAFPHLADVPVIVISAVSDSYDLQEYHCTAIVRKSVGIENTIVELARKYVAPARPMAPASGPQSAPQA